MLLIGGKTSRRYTNDNVIVSPQYCQKPINPVSGTVQWIAVSKQLSRPLCLLCSLILVTTFICS